MGGVNTGQGSVGQTIQPLVVRPCQSPPRSRGQIVGAAGLVLASLLYSLRFHGLTRLAVVGVAVAIAIGIFVWMHVSRRRMQLTLCDGQLIVSGLLRDRVVLTEGPQGRIVHVELTWRHAPTRRSRLWLLLNGSGSTEVGLNRDVWDDRQLEHLRESLGLPIEVIETPKRPSELRHDYPRSVPWWAVHPAAATSLAIVVIATLVVALQHLAS
jgi:hypothetical protein